MRTLLIVGTLLAAQLLAGCGARRDTSAPTLLEAASSGNALAIADALETLIAAGTATLSDRQFAYDQIRARAEDSAEYAFARASVAGRVVQQRGLLASPLLAEAEAYARRSRELDPDFRDGAATRMLGTLYVVAPARLLQHGNSELGLELLEGLATKHPDVAENHLRLAEAYIMLNDPKPAVSHLCRAQEERARLRRDDQQLLDELSKGIGPLRCE